GPPATAASARRDSCRDRGRLRQAHRPEQIVVGTVVGVGRRQQFVADEDRVGSGEEAKYLQLAAHPVAAGAEADARLRQGGPGRRGAGGGGRAGRRGGGWGGGARGRTPGI